MPTWSGMRRRLENEFLAESLRGHIQYFLTTYKETHDGTKGRIAIRYDGEEILRGNAFWFWFDLREEDKADWAAGKAGRDNWEVWERDKVSLSMAFLELDSQSIEKSLESPHLLVRIMAILDRRVGKRRLISMGERMREGPEILKRFYAVRMEAEGLGWAEERKEQEDAVLQ